MLNLPQKINEVYNRIVADVKSYNKQAQPAVKNSWIGSIIVAIAGRIYDVYQKINFILKQAFMDTATGDYLKRWGGYVGIYQKSAVKATGNFIFTGTVNSIIAKGTQVLVGKNIYTVNNSVQIASNSIEAANFTQEFDVVRITFANPHNLGTGMAVSINGQSYTIEVINAYVISISTSDELTAPLIVNYDSVLVACTPAEAGYSYNIASGTTGKTSKVISGIDLICYTDYAGFTGGADIEDIEDLRARIIYRYQHPVTNFNTPAIITFMQSLPNIGPVKVHEITPAVGQVTIYYLLTDNQIPTAGKTASVLAAIDSDLRPANTDISDVFLFAATPKVVNFKIENLYPLSVGIKDAVKESLKQYFNSLSIEQSIKLNDLIEVINGSVDLETGQKVTGFNLISPTADIIINQGEFAKLGDIDL